MKKTLTLVFLSLALAACGQKDEPGVIAPADKSAYVILPANYVVDVADGSRVTVNPAAQEFALFAGKADAFKALNAREDLNGEDWRVYRLEGSVDDLGRPCGAGLCLAVPAKIADWEKE